MFMLHFCFLFFTLDVDHVSVQLRSDVHYFCILFVHTPPISKYLPSSVVLGYTRYMCRLVLACMHVIGTSSSNATSGDFSHGPQHVFWTCLYQMDKSRDMSLKNTGFLDGLK